MIYNRPLSELAAVSKMREARIVKTQVYFWVHADLRSAATSEFASAVEFRKRSNFVNNYGFSSKLVTDMNLKQNSIILRLLRNESSWGFLWQGITKMIMALISGRKAY